MFQQAKVCEFVSAEGHGRLPLPQYATVHNNKAKRTFLCWHFMCKCVNDFVHPKELHLWAVYYQYSEAVRIRDGVQHETLQGSTGVRNREGYTPPSTKQTKGSETEPRPKTTFVHFKLHNILLTKV